MIPLVGSVQELEIETDARKVLAEVAEQAGSTFRR